MARPGEAYTIKDGHKKCNGCGQIKPVDQFSRNGKILRGRCKPCEKTRVSEWVEKNRDKARENWREYRQDNLEERRQYDRDRSKTEHRKATKRESYGRNSQKYKERSRLRKAKIRAIDELLPGEWETMVGQCGNRCIVPGCGASPVTQDHVIPLSKGGRHHISNLQPLCGPCNGSKGSEEIDYRGA